ncbi:hypothetical protein HDU83_008156 [Entophlyctis luteolus]|nr:hypothetical protein HDU83_008156 [Entophlyctis luteolus]
MSQKQSDEYWQNEKASTKPPSFESYLKAMKLRMTSVILFETSLSDWFDRYLRALLLFWPERHRRPKTVRTDVEKWFNLEKAEAASVAIGLEVANSGVRFTKSLALCESEDAEAALTRKRPSTYSKLVHSKSDKNDSKKKRIEREQDRLDEDIEEHGKIDVEKDYILSSKQFEEEEEDIRAIFWPSGDSPKWESNELASLEAIYWRIIDLTEYDKLKSYLKPGDIKDVREIFTKAISGFSSRVAASDAETVLMAFDEISAIEAIQVCEIVVTNGPIGGLRELASLLRAIPKVQDEYDDELDAVLGSHTFDSNRPRILGEINRIITHHELNKILDEDVKYVFNLFKKSYEMIEKGIPSRANTERDLDANFYWDMFRCLDSVASVHYGEPIVKASRFRRRLSCSRNEGYHVDFLFTSLKAQHGFGDEFAVAENVGSSFDPGNKLNTDLFKLGKLMRDLYLGLTRSLMKNSQTSSKFVKAMDLLRIGGFRTSGFSVSTYALIHAGGGFYLRDIIDEVLVPIEMKNLKDNCSIARAMLKMKGMIGKTISHYGRIREQMAAEKGQRRESMGKLWVEVVEKASPIKKKTGPKIENW